MGHGSQTEKVGSTLQQAPGKSSKWKSQSFATSHDSFAIPKTMLKRVFAASDRLQFIFGDFHQWGYPKMDGLWRKIPLKWMIWGYPRFRKPPFLYSMCKVSHFSFYDLGWVGYRVICCRWFGTQPIWRGGIFRGEDGRPCGHWARGQVAEVLGWWYGYSMGIQWLFNGETICFYPSWWEFRGIPTWSDVCDCLRVCLKIIYIANLRGNVLINQRILGTLF